MMLVMYRKSTPYLLLVLPLAVMLLVFLVPTLQALYMSLLDYSQLYTPAFVGLDNYTRLLSASDFWQTLANMAWLLLAIVPAMVALALTVAMALNWQVPGIRLIRLLVYLPVITSMVVAGLTWKWLYMKDGLLNAMLNVIGLPGLPWLTAPDLALFAVAAVVLWKGTGYYAMMVLAGLQGVSKELLEAAEIDGAGPWQRFRHVTLVQVRPVLWLVALVCTIGTLKLFTEVYVLTRGGPLGATRTLVYLLYEEAFERLNLGRACAVAFVLMALLVIIGGIRWAVDRARGRPADGA